MSEDLAWLWTDRVAMIAGLLISIPVLWTWWQIVFGEPARRRKWLREVSREPGSRPGVLVVDLLSGRDITASVKNYIAADDTLKAIGSDCTVSVRRDEPLTPDDVADLARELRAAARRLQDAGVDVVHLFHAGPCVSALLIGAELSNGPRVLVYHFDQGKYCCFGPLEPLR